MPKLLSVAVISKLLASSGSVVVLAISFTPELTNSLAILVAACFVGLVNFYVARTARLLAMREIAKAIAPVEQKIDAIAPVVASIVPVVASIEGHVNSEKTRDAGVIAAHKLEIALQREMIDEMKKAAALLAQAKATIEASASVAQAAVAGASAPKPVVMSDTQHLGKIEEHTDATAKNTAKTEAVAHDTNATVHALEKDKKL